MSKLKYYALCSNNIAATKRHATHIPHNDLVIVLNSLNTSFIKEAEVWLKEQGIEHYITESDGTPATGKNTVLNLFLASDNDYMVMIDGDDFITPHGLVVYNMISKLDSPPDAVALEQQYGIRPNNCLDENEIKLSGMNSSLRCAEDRTNPDHIHGLGHRPFYKSKDWWDQALDGVIDDQGADISEEEKKLISDASKKLNTYSYDYLNGKETYLRITFYSKKGATYNFDNQLVVGEDSYQYFQLKDAWAAGELDLKHIDELYPTYVYDQRITGIARWYSSTMEGLMDWITNLNKRLDQLSAEGKMHTTKPSIIELDFAEDYYPDTLGLVSYPCRPLKH